MFTTTTLFRRTLDSATMIHRNNPLDSCIARRLLSRKSPQGYRGHFKKKSKGKGTNTAAKDQKKAEHLVEETTAVMAQPKSQEQLVPRRNPFEEGASNLVAPAVIAVPCLGITVMWFFARWYQEEQNRPTDEPPPPGWSTLLGIHAPQPLFSLEEMIRNFTVIPLALIRGEQPKMALVTSIFSHMDFDHLAGNMLGLYMCTLNIPLAARIGTPRFVALFVGCGLAGHALQFTLPLVHGDPSYLVACSFGASGGIAGAVACAVLWRPHSTLFLPILLINGIKSYWYLILTVGYDVFHMCLGTKDGVGHGAHVGGAIAGAMAFKVWKRTLLKAP